MIFNTLVNEKFQYLILSTILATGLAIILDFSVDPSTLVVLAQNDNLTSGSTSLTSTTILDSVTGNESDIAETLGQPFYVENTKSTYMRVLNIEILF